MINQEIYDELKENYGDHLAGQFGKSQVPKLNPILVI